jgi:hypothetical protein
MSSSFFTPPTVTRHPPPRPTDTDLPRYLAWVSTSKALLQFVQPPGQRAERPACSESESEDGSESEDDSEEESSSEEPEPKDEPADTSNSDSEESADEPKEEPKPEPEPALKAEVKRAPTSEAEKEEPTPEPKTGTVPEPAPEPPATDCVRPGDQLGAGEQAREAAQDGQRATVPAPG